MAYSRLKIIEKTAVLQHKTPITGNYCERSNVVSEHSRDLIYYKITSTVYMNRQFMYYQSWKSEDFSIKPIKSSHALDTFLKVRIMRSPLGYHSYNTLNGRIRTYD